MASNAVGRVAQRARGALVLTAALLPFLPLGMDLPRSAPFAGLGLPAELAIILALVLDASPRRVGLVRISRDDDGTSEAVPGTLRNSIGHTASG
jgi:hypothetical protein